jgi:hypothetical protein
LEQGIVALLEKTFVEGKTYEVVVTTLRDKGKGSPNAAAIGVVRRGQDLHMKVFKGSDTFENLKGLKKLGINIITIQNINVIAQAALRGWGSPEAEFEPDQYENMRGFPFLKKAAVQIDCQAEDWTEQSGKDDFGQFHTATFKPVPEAYRINDENGRPVEKGTTVVLEALVFATRWKVATGELKAFLQQRLKIYLDKAIELGGEGNLKSVDIIHEFLTKG